MPFRLSRHVQLHLRVGHDHDCFWSRGSGFTARCAELRSCLTHCIKESMFHASNGSLRTGATNTLILTQQPIKNTPIVAARTCACKTQVTVACLLQCYIYQQSRSSSWSGLQPFTVVCRPPAAVRWRTKPLVRANSGDLETVRGMRLANELNQRPHAAGMLRSAATAWDAGVQGCASGTASTGAFF